MTKPIIRRTRRSELNPIMVLTFPTGVDEAGAAEVMKGYGMTGYTLESKDGLVQARRSDLQSIAKDTTMDIKLNDEGVIATVARSETHVEPKSQVALVAFEFDATKFDEKTVAEWLARNSIDSKVSETENSDKSFVVRRSDVPENEETRMVELEDGVTAVVTRSDVTDIPDGFIAVINECCYGNWGWGQLDFVATMADIAFSEQMRESVERLSSVLRDILYWNNLPLEVRKTLANTALTQFGAYVGTIMDSLPRQLLVSVERSAQLTKEKTMSKAGNEGGATTKAAGTVAGVARAGEVAATTTGAPATEVAGAGAEADKPMTRADIDKMIADGIAAGLQRAGIKSPEQTAEEKATEAQTTLVRNAVKAGVDEALKPVMERMTALEGSTVVRSGAGDPATRTPAEQAVVDKAAGVEGKGGKADVFRGAIPGIGGNRSKAAAAE